MAIKAVIWDLDGTLLDTLGDLAGSVNAALESNGLPQRDIEEVRAFVGHGIYNLIERAMPEAGRDHPLYQQTVDAFVAHYAQHSRDLTCPYPGILDMLDALIARGIKMGIVSNKIDFAVQELNQAYFGDRMPVAVGDDPARRKKPAPDAVFEAMKRLGVTPQESVYVGDSDVDVITARNAGCACCAVSWGFRPRACLEEAGAVQIADTVEELLAQLLAL